MNYFKTLLKNSDKILLLLPVAFGIISVVMIASTCQSSGFFMNKSVLVQAFAYVLGFGLMFFTMFLDYQWFTNFEKAIYIGSLLFLLTVYIPGLGVESFGARSWINLGITTFQPSEIVKITFVLLFANYLSRNRNSLYKLKGLVKAFLYAVPFIGIIAKEDLGSGLVFCSMWIFMVFFAGLDYKILGRTAGIFVILLPVMYRFMAGHQKDRILAFLHPDDLSIVANYQVWNSKIAIGSGGVFGKGLFKGTQQGLDYLPVKSSDFIFSVICEETGFIGGATVIALFILFIGRISLICHESRDLYGALIVVGFIGMFLFQIFENIAMTMGIMPCTGITLPFISCGGSSILSNMIALGLILNIGARSKMIGV